MKFKKLIGAATLLLAAFTTTTAATFSPGGKWDSMNGDNSTIGFINQVLPFDKDIQYTGCQSVFTQDEISQLAPVTDASGKTTVNSITEVSVAICPISNYGALSGTAGFKVYLTPTDKVEFEKVDGNYLWFDYSAEGTVSGSVLIDAADEMCYVSDEPFTITIPLAEPFEVTTGNFVLTILMDNQIEDEYFCWDVGSYSYNPNMSVSRARSGKSEDETTLSGKFASGNKSASLPIVNFTYTTEEREAVGGGETYGDPTDHYVGPWDDPDTDEGSAAPCIPPDNNTYLYGFAQAIYTPDQLNELQKADGNGVTTADINSLTFKYSFLDPGSINGSMSWTVYIQNTDLNELPKVDNKYQWVEYSEDVKGSGSLAYEYYEFYEDELECTATFDTPLRYEGKSLLVTWVTEGSLDEYGFGNTCYGLVFSGENGQSVAYGSDSTPLEHPQGTISGGNNPIVKSVLPVLKLGITPVTVASAVKPVVFESVEASIRKVTVDPSVKFGYNYFKGANLITLDFKLKDEANSGPYEIKLGTKVLGTIEGTEGVIAGVPYDKDAVLTVTPQAEGAIGSSTTVDKSAFEGFFPAPTLVEAQEGSSALYTEYDAYSKYDYNRATVEGIATFRLNSTIPFVTIGGTYDGNNLRIVYPTSPSLPEIFESFRPVNDATDYEANEGRISFYNSKIAEQYVTHGKIEAPTSSLRISAKLFVKAPVLVADVPAVAAAFTPDNDTYDIASAAGRSIKEIQKDYNNGSSYASSTATATLAWDELIENVTYPDGLVLKSADNYIDIFAPAGHQIHWCFVAAPAEDEQEPEAGAPAMRASLPEGEQWTAAEGGNVHTHYFDAANPGKLYLKTTDAEGNDSGLDELVEIKGDGTFVGIDAVDVDLLDEGEIYFDLQGRRVANPAAGGLYIRLRSGKAAKVAL